MWLCVGGRGAEVEHAFSIPSSPALTCSSLPQNMFVSHAKSVRLQHNKHVHLIFGRWFRNSHKRTKARGKVPAKLHFRYGWTRKKYRNKVKTKECKKTALHVHLLCTFCRYQVVFFRSLISALLLYFSQAHPERK